MDMDMDISIEEKNTEQKKSRTKRRKSKNRKPNLGENTELCGYREEKHTVGGILKVEEMEISKSGVQDTLLNVDFTVQSPIQKHMDPARILVEEDTKPKKTRKRRKSKNRKPNLGELCGFGEEKHAVGGILEVEEMDISKSGVQDTLLNVDLTVQSPIQKHMDTARNLVEENTEPKESCKRRKSKNRIPNLGENMELCGYGVEKHTVGGILEVEEMEISKSEVQDTLLNVDLTVQSPVQKHMDTARNLVEENMEPKKTRKRRKSKNRKPNAGENMELCGYGEEKHTVGGILEVEEMEISKSGVHDTLLNVDLTVQSPVQKHMDTARNLVEENTEPKKTRKRRKSKNRKPNLGENMEFCGFGDKKHTVGGILEVEEEMEISKSGVQDTLLNVDLTVQSPVQKHMDTARNLVEENTEPKKTRKRRKSKKRKPNLGENMELCGYREEKHTVGGILEVEEMKISESGVLDTLLNVDLTVQSPIQKHMDTARNLVEESTEKKKNRRRKPKAQYKDNLQILDQTEVVSALSLSDNPQVVGGDDTLNNVQEEIFRDDPVAVVGKVNNFVKISHPSPERTPVARLRRKLLILDVNGLLADVVCPAPKNCKADANISKRAIFKRPFCCDFLRFCFERFDVGIWSSRSKKVLDGVVDYLLGDLKHKLLIFWDMSHCTGTRFKTLENRHKPLVFKELRKIWGKSDPSLPWKKGDYNESNTLLLDDSPYKALLNPVHTGIFPLSYSFKDVDDNSLGPGGDLRVYLEGLATADNWKEYVEKHPFGQRGIDESSSCWAFYSTVLGSRSNLWSKS